PIGRELGFSESQVGLIMMSGAIVLVCFSLLWGRWINRIGFRRAMQIGMLAYAVTTLGLGVIFALALAGKIESQIAFTLAIMMRVLFSACSGGVFPSAQAYFVATSDADTRTSAIANIGIAFSLGMMFGPAVAAMASNISLHAPFYIMSGLALLSTFLLQLYMQKAAELSVETKTDAPTAAKIDWLNHPALPFLFLIMLVSLSLNGVQQIATFYIQDLLGLGAKQAAQRVGAAMTLMSMAMISVQFVAAQRLKLSPTAMINIGALTFLIAMQVFIFLPSWPSFLLAMGLFGAGVGFLYPAVIASQTLWTKPNEQGQIAGANVSAQGVGLVLGPISCASLYQLKVAFPFMMISALAILAILVSIGSQRRRVTN
ncbi:MAG: MFS transporter, partial [Pseudomonadota bacterium]